jgi:hypothetical protein
MARSKKLDHNPPNVNLQRPTLECPIVRFYCSGWRSADLSFFGEVAGWN